MTINNTILLYYELPAFPLHGVLIQICLLFQNVKLLQQFMSPHTGMVYDPTRTGMKL